MAFQTKKTVVVPLDISDVINLNHLDVIPSRFQTGLCRSVADNEPLTEPALALPKSPVERNKNPSYTNPCKIHGHRRGTERSIGRRKSPRTVVTKGFDRRCKMTRVIAGYAQDSESCECYKQARLLKNYNLIRMRQQVNLADIFSPNSVGSPESSSSSIMESDDESETLMEKSERVEVENNNKERQFEDVGVGETPSAAMLRLTEALKQLESTCSDASEVHEDYRPPHSVLTLRPSRTNPFVGPSSSHWRSMMASNSYLGSCLVKDSNQTLRSYVTPSNLQESRHYLQHSAPSSQYTEYLENTPPTALSHQKAAAIWDWVSSKYTCEDPTVLTVPDCSKLNTNNYNACNELCSSKMRMESPQIQLQRTSLARSFSDAARLTNCRRPLKAFEPTDFSLDNPPRTPIIDPPPLFGPRTPPVNTTERYIQLTPPSSSTVWNFSPLYRGSSSGFPVVEKSSCSLTPAVNSLASLNDVRSGDDVATCSTASTVTEMDCNSPEAVLKNSPKTPSDHYILNLIGQICKPAEGKEKVREVEATTVSAEGTIAEPILPKEQVLTHRLSKEETMVEIAPVKPRRSVSPCSVTASDLHILNMKVSARSLSQRTPSVKLDRSLVSESRGSISVPKKQRRKTKKGKRMTNSERVGAEYCNDDDERNWKKCVNDRDTQTANGRSIKVRPTESESTRLRKLKSALPRTPGGSYSFRNRIAEAAIAEYVKAELEASLLSPKVSEKNQKPRLPSLDSFLKKITASDVKCGCRGRGGPKQGPAPKIRVAQRSTALVKKAPLTAKAKPPFKPTDTSPRWHPIPPTIPKISTRVNFLKYQQQSLAALIGKSRASKQALVPGAVTGDFRVPLSYSYLSLYPKDFQHSVSGWNSYPNFNKLRGNRNNVTVVFGDSKD